MAIKTTPIQIKSRWVETYLFDIYNHVRVINDELGKVKRDVFWLRQIVLGILIVLIIKLFLG
ncbi:MAG: hypothetical protein DRJ03_19590 [Chloroflexi bacterium]|nr:MAG: hypothetical protein DRJ03_19590 [Chloroflexota bacterium]